MTKKVMGVIAAGLLGAGALHAYNWKQAQRNLTPKEQAFAAAAALAAAGNLPKLQTAFNRALDEGWTVSELKEMVLQLYAYTGFPRCLNTADALQTVLRQRRAAGKTDEPGQTPAVIAAGTDKYELGRQNLARLMKTDIPSRPETFIQDTDTFLKEHLFADIFARGVLTDRQRELATVSFLTALGNVNPQLRAHMGLAMNAGVTPAQIEGVCAVIKQELGRKTAQNGLNVLNQLSAQQNG